MCDLVDYCPEKAFLVIDEVFFRTDNENTICNSGERHLESLLMKYGESVMSQIESSMKSSIKFRDLFHRCI